MVNLLVGVVLGLSPLSTNNLNASGINSSNDLMEYAFIDYISDEECTVTIEAKFEAEVGWSIVSVAGEGTITFSSTKSTCAEAVSDIRAGMAAAASIFG
jgi:hypothetical protein